MAWLMASIAFLSFSDTGASRSERAFSSLADPDLLRPLPQGDDGRDEIQAADPGEERPHLILNDRLGPLELLLPLFHVRLQHGLEIIDIVEIDVVDRVDLRVDVAGHGDVDDEDRLVSSRPHRLPDLIDPQDVVGRGRGAEQDVDLREGGGDRIQRDRLSLEGGGQPLRILQGPAGNEDARDPVGHQMARGEFRHLPCAGEKGLAIAQVAEYLLGQFDGHIAHRDGASRQLGLCPHTFRYVEALVEEPVQDRAHRLLVYGLPVGLLDLSRDLRFPDHHRVHSRGDAKQVGNRLVIPVLVVKPAPVVFLEAEPVCEVLADDRVDLAGPLFRDQIEFDTVAGRQNQRFLDTGLLFQPLQGLLQGVARESEPFPDRDRRSLVVQPDAENLHDSSKSLDDIEGGYF